MYKIFKSLLPILQLNLNKNTHFLLVRISKQTHMTSPTNRSLRQEEIDEILAATIQEQEDYKLALAMSVEEERVRPKQDRNYQLKHMSPTTTMHDIQIYSMHDFDELEDIFDDDGGRHTRVDKNVYTGKPKGSVRKKFTKQKKVLKGIQCMSSDFEPTPFRILKKPAHEELRVMQWKHHNTATFDIISKEWTFPNKISGQTAVVSNGKMWIFGGIEKEKCSNKLYTFDFATREWDIVKCFGKAPPKMYGHTAVVTERNTMIVFGGALHKRTTSNLSNSTYCFNFYTSKWSKLDTPGDVPSGRCGHTAVVFKDRMYVFGGLYVPGGKLFYSQNLSDFSWSAVNDSGDKPEPRSNHTAVVNDDSMYVFGGYNTVKDCFSNDLYEFNLIRYSWRKIVPNIKLPKLYKHSAVTSSNSMIIFGGNDSFNIPHSINARDRTAFKTNDTSHYSVLYEYFFDTGKWRTIKTFGDVPFLKKGHSAVMYHGSMWVFGGFVRFVVKSFLILLAATGLLNNAFMSYFLVKEFLKYYCCHNLQNVILWIRCLTSKQRNYNALTFL